MKLLFNRTRTNKSLKINNHAYIHDKNACHKIFSYSQIYNFYQLIGMMPIFLCLN